VNSLIFRTMAGPIAVTMMLFSLVILLRGHNDVGGGFAGGMIAASAAAIYGMAHGIGAVRKRLPGHPLDVAAVGILFAAGAGALPGFSDLPFFTSLWLPNGSFGTPSLFDLGVYLTVFGAVMAVTLALEDGGSVD
jgi:multicomponent Na+:H+ antiporter subunit B